MVCCVGDAWVCVPHPSPLGYVHKQNQPPPPSLPLSSVTFLHSTNQSPPNSPPTSPSPSSHQQPLTHSLKPPCISHLPPPRHAPPAAPRAQTTGSEAATCPAAPPRRPTSWPCYQRRRMRTCPGRWYGRSLGGPARCTPLPPLPPPPRCRCRGPFFLVAFASGGGRGRRGGCAPWPTRAMPVWMQMQCVSVRKHACRGDGGDPNHCQCNIDWTHEGTYVTTQPPSPPHTPTTSIKEADLVGRGRQLLGPPQVQQRHTALASPLMLRSR